MRMHDHAVRLLGWWFGLLAELDTRTRSVRFAARCWAWSHCTAARRVPVLARLVSEDAVRGRLAEPGYVAPTLDTRQAIDDHLVGIQAAHRRARELVKGSA